MKILMWLGIMVIALGGVAFFWVVANGQDIGPVDTSDLVPAELVVPAGENAYPLILEAAAAVDWPEGLDPEIIDGISKEQRQNILAANGDVLDIMDRAGEMNSINTLPDARVGKFPLTEWKQVLAVMELSVREFMENSAVEGALNALGDMFRFGNLLACQGRTSLDRLTGWMILERVLELTEKMMVRRDLSIHFLETIRAMCPDPSCLEAALINTIKQNFMIVDGTLIQLTTAETTEDPERLKELRRLSENGQYPRDLLRNYMLHPNRTRQLIADYYREVIANAALPCRDHTHGMADHIFSSSDENMLLRILKPNLLGKTTMNLSGKWFSDDIYCRLRMKLDTTRLLILCRMFEIQTGAPPESLQDLIPEYIDSIPVNWVTGETITLDSLQGKGLPDAIQS